VNSFRKNKPFFSSLYTVVILLFISACSSTPQNDDYDSRDPIEPVNRVLWTFTWDYTDKYITKPVSIFYTEYTPVFLRSGLYNMSLNLNEPSSMINNLLQAKFVEAGKSAGRFLLNTTIGLLGFYDPASDFNWTGDQEEFGEVLGAYGVGDGPYFVMPGIGPTSVREEVGDFVDKYYWPLAVIDFWPNLARWGIIGMEKRAALVEQEPLLRDSLDVYEFVKNAYFQNMNYRLHDGNPPVIINEDEEEDLDEFMDEFD
jgi:phospholipid-binding lipoprotein MlaA